MATDGLRLDEHPLDRTTLPDELAGLVEADVTSVLATVRVVTP